LTLVPVGFHNPDRKSSGRSAEKQPATAWFTDIAKRSNFAYWTNNDLSVREILSATDVRRPLPFSEL